CGDATDNDCDGQADNLDGDGDGFVAPACGGTDCDDTNAAVLPGGVDSEQHRLEPGGTLTLGSRGCDLDFPDDLLLTHHHASLVCGTDGVAVRDEGSENGVFFQLPSRRKVELRHGDLLRAGRQFLMVEGVESGFEIAHYRVDGSPAGRHALPRGSVVLGRRADLTLDADDTSLSRRQLALTVESGRLLAKDLLSVNGTYLRVQGSRRLEHGDRFLLGRQRFVFSTRRDAVFDDDGPSAVSRPITGATVAAAMQRGGQGALAGPTPAAAGAAPSAVVAEGAPSITFQPGGRTVPVLPGQTILEAAEAHGVEVQAECRAGICGSDPLRILSGGEHLESGPEDGEAETLEDLCGLEPGPCRLACVARVKGPVVVEILSR
ncbi:MAG: FHA domain-containing protein, partial [Holophagales bacterium]|nr:FHA domain-containing protein [Holophagales bacterium]